MSSMALASIVFGCVFGGALLGMFLREALPEHHLSQDSKDVVKLGTGLIATMAALVISLLISSAKSSFDMQNNEFRQSAADLIVLDRVLAHYGTETKDARDLIRQTVAAWLDLIWPEDSSRRQSLDAVESAPTPIESIQDKLRDLTPRNDAQRWLQSRALQLTGELAQTRWLFLEQLGSHSIPMPFVTVLVIWLAVIFVSFGLFAPRNSTVVVALLFCSLSVSGAIFMILEMEQPYEGLMKISSAPMRETLAHLGQ